jgi:hypothetical protein
MRQLDQRAVREISYCRRLGTGAKRRAVLRSASGLPLRMRRSPKTPAKAVETAVLERFLRSPRVEAHLVRMAPAPRLGFAFLTGEAGRPDSGLEHYGSTRCLYVITPPGG